MQKTFFFNFINVYYHRHLFGAGFDQKLEEVISVRHYGIFQPNYGSHDHTADS